jgi:hypothetical protein
MEATSKTRSAGRSVRTKKRRSSSQSQPATQRTGAAAGTGFLNQHYWPVTDDLPGLITDQQKIEREFFTSLSYLSAVYGFTPADTSGFPYPYNISAAYQEVNRRLATEDIITIIARNDDGEVCLATLKSAGTGRLLYYLPVRPLFAILRNRRNRKRRGLFLSLYYYLFRLLQLPHYYYTNSFIEQQYDYIDCWYEDDVDEDGKPLQERLETDTYVKMVRHFGKRLVKTCSHRFHVDHWQERNRLFKPKDDLDILLQDLSCDAHRFYLTHPHINFEIIAPPYLVEPSMSERADISYMFSFWWTGEDGYSDDIIRSANEHLGNCDVIEPLMACQLFDKPQATKQLDIAAIEELQDLLEKFGNVLTRFDEKYNISFSNAL